ncbi:hypothetical protein L209DRAFT_751336 [Thermothelomyces heterothallicus CBS 203.75]
MDSLAEFFADPNKPKNAKKKPILKELFRVAKMEERYKRNEIGEPPRPLLAVPATRLSADQLPQMPAPR